MTSQLIFSLYYRSHVHQIRNGSVKECEVEMVGEECEVNGFGLQPLACRCKVKRRVKARPHVAPTSMHRVKR